MPIYTLCCKWCGDVEDKILSINETIPKCHCKGPRFRTPTLPNFYLSGADFQNIGMSNKSAWRARTEKCPKTEKKSKNNM